MSSRFIFETSTQDPHFLFFCFETMPATWLLRNHHPITGLASRDMHSTRASPQPSPLRPSSKPVVTVANMIISAPSHIVPSHRWQRIRVSVEQSRSNPPRHSNATRVS